MLEIPVIDIFAGPGGLSHGFSAFNSKHAAYRVGLSIEKDAIAHKTLLLRAFLRQFRKPPVEYYLYIKGEKDTTLEKLKRTYASEWAKAEQETKQWELGKIDFGTVHASIKEAIAAAPKVVGVPAWVLIGGPPCQAYSLAGRSRMKNAKGFSRDKRHTLYREYLKIVASHQPAIFVMENVKGILSSRHGSHGRTGSIFCQILDDLRDPGAAFGNDAEMAAYITANSKRYRIYSFVTKASAPELLDPSDFVIRSEEWGIPQKRHRVILLGVREDLSGDPGTLGDFFKGDSTTIADVLHGLPMLRSRISKGGDSPDAWAETIRSIAKPKLLNTIADIEVRHAIQASAARVTPSMGIGQRFAAGEFRPNKLSDWLWDKRLNGVLQHESRSHMRSDLIRYFFAACGATQKGYSLKLGAYPKSMLPNHENLKTKDKEIRKPKVDFEDRFRVQVQGSPSTTITSHISKDGHYYIHYDALQCRSLTVREAARLQTFPDSYYFEGTRTEQYHQVGNAVPALLANKLATVVSEFLLRDRSRDSPGCTKQQRRIAAVD